ncbi:MAG: ABC transporter ATP-binding protein [Actinomycetaceae bacterium]|nr:ABC transporter ATP-binding protein [Actinomycetaceae bacterium]
MNLSVRALETGYRRGEAVLRNVDLDCPAASVTAIVGPNGCGKSTLLRCLARLHRPWSGSVTLDGDDLWRMSPRKAARRVSFLGQSPQAPPGMSVAGLISLGRHPHRTLLHQWSNDDARALDAALEATGMAEYADRPLAELSGGQQQRAWIAMTICQEAPTLLADEPISALDLGHAIDVMDLLRDMAAAGRTVVTVVHDLAMAARYADQVFALDGGIPIAKGPPGTVITPQVVGRLYGVDAEVLTVGPASTPVVVAKSRLKGDDS